MNSHLKIPADVGAHREANQYFGFLERMKTVKEYVLDGKKILLKFDLKLKDNCEKEMKELEEYLLKRKEE